MITQETTVKSRGFAFNPFERLEASNDAYLAEYLVGHEMFAVAWETSLAALFAPPGGGKTAMRIYTLRACWLNNGQRRKFPISYDLLLFADPARLTSLESHLEALCAATASDLLLACAYHPELYLDLSAKRRQSLLTLLSTSLPSDLAYNLTILEETGDPRQLSDHLDRAYRLPELPSAFQLRLFCQQAQADLPQTTPEVVAPAVRFECLLEFLQADLAYESVFILLDGVDGDGSTLSPQAQCLALASLFDQAAGWAKRGLYLKAFLPLELEAWFKFQPGEFFQKALRATLTWDIPKLAEILRKRVYIASQGKFGSLDALSSPALRDVETLIAQSAQPLPREAVVLAGLTLENYLAGQGEVLEPADLRRAEAQYIQHSFLTTASPSF